MSATVNQGITAVEMSGLTTGAITLPSYLNIASADDYEVIFLEGVGTLDVGTKTATQFTITSATASKVRIELAKTNALKHVN